MLSAGGEARISECKNTGAQALDLNAGVGDFGIYHNECGGWVGRAVVGFRRQHQFILSIMTILILLSGDYRFKSLRILWSLTHLMAAHQNRST